MRGLYKDLITWIQSDHLSTDNELKARAETNFKGDRQIDISLLSDDKVFRQAREYQTDTHLIQFLFTTRIMKDDMELLIQQMLGEDGYPDVILINSMIWDLTRYFKVATDMSYSDSAYQKKIDIECIQKYLDRTSMFLRRLRAILPPHTMVVWVCFPHCRPSLPPSEGRRGRGIQNTPLAKERNHFIRSVMIDGNFRIAQVVKSAGYDVLDLGFYMRNHAFYHYQKEDGMHWLPAGVRLMSQLLIQFLAKSWGIDTSQYFRRLEEKQSRRAVCAAKDQLQNYEFYTKDLPRISDDIAELAFENLSLSKKYTFNNVVEKGRTIAPFVQPTIRSIKRVTEYNPYGPRGGGDCSRFKEKYQLAPHISRSKAHDVDDLVPHSHCSFMSIDRSCARYSIDYLSNPCTGNGTSCHCQDYSRRLARRRTKFNTLPILIHCKHFHSV
ncbi:hypothetical protein PENTCL1PPCAC_30757 [Pristionchus entomophagus]|uniref:SGNH domain-containing protein n=1 Tax=Pristionchus entomophagus TaxID=358040 RepID=A0AAV5UPJ9_9BILA|nr:hypothetical protein PENTCL1PPCAC_30757 [Pristionchus entomophagus]